MKSTRLKVGDKVLVEGFFHWLQNDVWTLQTAPCTAIVVGIKGMLIRIKPDECTSEVGVYIKQCQRIPKKGDLH